MGKKSKRKRAGSDSGEAITTAEDGFSNGSSMVDSFKQLSLMLQAVQPELETFSTKLMENKSLSLGDMTKVFGLLVSELSKYLSLTKQNQKSGERVEELEIEKKQLEEAQSDLIEENKLLEEEKASTEHENQILKEEIIKTQSPSVIIKYIPVHEGSSDSFAETRSHTESQIKSLLACMNQQTLKFKTAYRMKARPNTTPTRPLSVKVEFESFAMRKAFMRNLYQLKRTEDFARIQVQPQFPSIFSAKLKQKEQLSFFIRRKLKTRTRIILKGNKLEIQFLYENCWIIYNEEEESQNQIISFKNAPYPKKISSK